jgi:hypothetical protein
MRSILALAVLVLCVSKASPEPEYSSLLAGSFPLGGGDAYASRVEIESSRPRADREPIAAPEPTTGAQTPAPASQTPAAAATNADPAALQSPSPSAAAGGPMVPLDALCEALLNAAQDNDLPVAFFANLIWQESGLHNDVVSSKGAMGIAQFMPQTAQEHDLKNPFDPLQALPASARLLRELREQFSNLGFVAAAYNAGPKRVSDWLARGRTLPRETRDYVLDVTGRSVEQWRKMPPDDVDLRFVRRLPCRDFPAFADLEQTQSQQAELERELARRAQAGKPQPGKPASAEKADAKGRSRRERLALHEHSRTLLRHEKVRTAEPERHGAKHEAKEHVRHLSRERHKQT